MYSIFKTQGALPPPDAHALTARFSRLFVPIKTTRRQTCFRKRVVFVDELVRKGLEGLFGHGDQFVHGLQLVLVRIDSGMLCHDMTIVQGHLVARLRLRTMTRYLKKAANRDASLKSSEPRRVV